MFWHVENLTKQSMLATTLPWDFKPSGVISQQVRHSKTDRQDWYKSADTKHYFYTALEPANPNMRPSKDNPPRAIHAFVADYDIQISPERVKEAIVAMPIKPAWVERSLGNNVRLVWTLNRPLATETAEFTGFVLEQAVQWLNLGLLPALDEGAFTSSTRLLCNGCAWEKTGHGDIPDNTLQAFFVSCGKKFNFKAGDSAQIPLDVVEAELKNRYPNFTWPSDFVPETQGPTFWIPESVSPTSAILKPNGMFTFAAHATHPFYTWSELLGAAFVKKFQTDSIAKATDGIYWDGKKFWKLGLKGYKSMDKDNVLNYFNVTCRMSAKPDADGVSPVATALRHIYDFNDIVGAAPFAFREPGPIEYQGQKVLNTYSRKPWQAAAEPQKWGENFPFLAMLLDHLFDPKEQKESFLAWFRYAYQSAVNQAPVPGQSSFFMGGAGVGKTLIGNFLVGKALGGHIDASAYLVRGSEFNSELFEVPTWCVDDEGAANTEVGRMAFSNMLKKVTANQTFRYNKKFEIPVSVEWMGRVVVAVNLDFVSSRLLVGLDNTSMDKINLFRCAEEPRMVFPPRLQTIPIIERELGFFLRWLLDWEPPDNIKRDVRYGFASVHEPSLLDKAHQSSLSATFKELLLEALVDYFQSNPKAEFWMGSTVAMARLLMANPLNDMMVRSLRPEQVGRYLESIQREGVIPCSCETGPMKIRIWKFGKPIA